MPETDQQRPTAEQMYQATLDIKRVFILGAGFSRAVLDRMPLTDDLVERAFERDPLLQKKWKTLSSYFSPALRVRSQNPEIIEVLTILETYRQIIGKGGRADEEIKEVTKRLRYALGGILWDLSKQAQHAPTLLDQFIDSLDPSQDAVISLNWDVILEFAFDRKRISYGFDVDISPGSRNGRLLLLKPQGSVDWATVPPDGSRLHRVLSGQDALARRVISDYPTYDNPGTPAEAPAIVAPGFVGEDRSGSLAWSGYLMRWSLYSMLQASTIVVIGYRVPPDDLHMLTAASFAIPQDTNGGGVSIYVIDPADKTFRQWELAFKGLTTMGSPLSVRRYARSLQDALTCGLPR